MERLAKNPEVNDVGFSVDRQEEPSLTDEEVETTSGNITKAAYATCLA